VEYQEHQSHLWHIKYPVKDSTSFMVVATTRPETMLGDTAVAVHPEDSRYKRLIGKSVILPLLKREIPIIGDRQVDPEFGTGAVKVTPAHDLNDFEIGKRHKLAAVDILNPNGTLNENAGPYKSLDRFEARKKVIKDLEKQGLLLKIEPHHHSVGHCHRCNTIIEPWLSEQWFVRMKELAKPAIMVAQNGRLKIHPADRWFKTYINWLENIRDWCISRQLWWGHRIPVYYCRSCNEMMVARETPENCPKCNANDWRQDENVLDTWFSSWLWPFSTLGWPEKTADLSYFYPTSLLVTGPDIIFFWVARMVMAGMEFMHEVPFTDVYLNGIIRDHIGRKMSKSLGNGIDPLDIIDKFSADAMRYTLIMLSSEGQDINLSESHFEIGRNFSNKIWNAYRFIALNLDEPKDNFQDFVDDYQLADRWILSRLQDTIEDVTKNMEKYRINDSLSAVYHFFWHEYCDWYLELIKPRLNADKSARERATVLSISVHVMKTCMNLLHPYIPFITEEITNRLNSQNESSCVISEWPQFVPGLIDKPVEQDMRFIQEVISAIRNVRSEMNVPPGSNADLKFKTKNKMFANNIETYADYIRQLARISNITQMKKSAPRDVAAMAVVEDVELFIPLEGLIDLELEKKRLDKEITRLETRVQELSKKLRNEQYLEKAPEIVVQQDRDKLKNFSEKLDKLKQNLSQLNRG
jgi:valyl-tRNA synthetase